MVKVNVLNIPRDDQVRCPACRKFLPKFFGAYDEVVCSSCGSVWAFA